MNKAFALLCALVVTGCGAGDDPPWFIRGSARLPDCQDAPAYDLDGTTWFDDGTVTITSSGCGEPAGKTLGVCGLAWVFKQNGASVEILVDQEYIIKGRACSNQLHLEGGFWFTAQDDRGYCDYEDGVEAGIQSGGSTLTVADDVTTMTGILSLRERCTADYDVTFYRSGSPSGG